MDDWAGKGAGLALLLVGLLLSLVGLTSLLGEGSGTSPALAVAELVLAIPCILFGLMLRA